MIAIEHSPTSNQQQSTVLCGGLIADSSSAAPSLSQGESKLADGAGSTHR